MILDEKKIISSDIFQKIKLSFEKQRLFPSIIFESSCLEISNVFSKLISRMFFCESHSSCGVCKNCRLFNEGRISDFLEISTEDSVLKLEDVANVSSHFSLSSSYGSYRVIFIHEIEKLGIGATNSLLKVVEELPDRCILIMSSSGVSRMLATFLSRCVVFNIGTGFLDDSNLFDIYPFLSENLIKKVEVVLEKLLLPGSSSGSEGVVEDLYNEYPKLKSLDIYVLVHICLNKWLKKHLLDGKDTKNNIDKSRLSYIIEELSSLKKEGIKSFSLNTRLCMERILL